MKNEVIIKLNSACKQDHDDINKIIGVIDATNVAKLLDVVGLTANPRKSKVNKITNAIVETLSTTAEHFRFRSKGLLLATKSCETLQRNRYRLSFKDDSYEGVLDGGHNMLAIGLHILAELGEDQNVLNKIKRWDDFIEIWAVWRNEETDMDEYLSEFDFEVPVEIIYPSERYESKFVEAVLDISDARNNNHALKDQAMANHRQYYKVLKDYMDPVIEEKVEWVLNDSGKSIKSQDIVAMSLIPFLKLQEDGLLKDELPKINRVSIYSGKGKCVELYNKIFESYSNDGKINDQLILSAYALMKDLPKIYDTLYMIFAKAYNFHSPGFGKIGCVAQRKHTSQYYELACEDKYPPGFILPIFVSLSALLKVVDNKLTWRVDDPFEFIENNINEIVTLLVGAIKDNDYNPNTVGKNTSSYDGVKMSIELILAKAGK